MPRFIFIQKLTYKLDIENDINDWKSELWATCEYIYNFSFNMPCYIVSSEHFYIIKCVQYYRLINTPY